MAVQLNDEGLVKTVSAVVGHQAPDFVLNTQNNEPWRLSEQKGKVTVLLFYPLKECVVCNQQLCEVRNYWEQYLRTKAVFVGICPRTSAENLETVKKYNLPLNILSDTNYEVSNMFARHWILPLRLTRAVVVIDAKGIVRTQNVMFRLFRPTESRILTDIFSAQSEALEASYRSISKSFRFIGKN